MLYDLRLSSQAIKPIPIDPGIEMVKVHYIKQIHKIVQYYQTRSFGFDHQHILVRILYQLMVDYDLNLTDYIEQVKSQIPRICDTFKLYSIHSHGQPIENFLYGDSSYEYLIAVDHEVNYFKSYDDWKKIVPIYPIYHTDYDLSLSIPINNYDRILPVYSVWLIDIVLLAIQYKRWIETTTVNESDIDPGKFIRAYVLPNILSRHVDISIINRLFQIHQYGLPISPLYTITTKYPFYIGDYGDKLDQYLNKYLETIQTSDYRYVDIFSQIPTITHRVASLVSLPYIPAMKQLLLPIWLSRIELIYHLVQIAGDRTYKHDKSYLTGIKSPLRRLKALRVMDDMPVEIGYVEEMMQYLMRV